MKRINLIHVFIAAMLLLIMVALIAFLYYGGDNADNMTARAISDASGGDVYNVLLLGRDDVAGLCDSVMLVSVNTGSGDINVMQIPRDTYFNVSSNSYKKINGALNALGSAEELSRELGDALGTKIHYYLCVGTETVKRIVDAVSGIEIDIPHDMDYEDPAQGLSIHLRAGKQTLNGREAIGFLRYRSGYISGDIGRLDAQKLFLNALVNKLGENRDISRYYELFNTLKAYAQTNIREQDILSIGLKCSKTKNGKVYYLTAPGEAVQTETSGAWYYVLSKDALAEIVSTRFASAKDKKDFDRNNKFVDKRVKPFYDIYNKRYSYRVYTADDIANNININ